MKDYQVKQIYKAEEELQNFKCGRTLFKEDITSLVTRISVWADIEAPEIVIGAEYSVDEISYGNKDVIFLPVFAQNPWYICHEMTHVILDRKDDIENDHHGANFASLYLGIVKWVFGDQLERSLRKNFLENNVRIGQELV